MLTNIQINKQRENRKQKKETKKSVKVRKKFMLQTYKLQNKIPRAKFVCFYKAEISKPEWYF